MTANPETIFNKVSKPIYQVDAPHATTYDLNASNSIWETSHAPESKPWRNPEGLTSDMHPLDSQVSQNTGLPAAPGGSTLSPLEDFTNNLIEAVKDMPPTYLSSRSKAIKKRITEEVPLVEPFAPANSPVIAAIPLNKFSKEEHFWNYIEALAWRDKSDHILNLTQLKNKLLRDLVGVDLVDFWKQYNIVKDQLQTRLQEHGILSSARFENNDTLVNTFLSHIIAKGLTFYVCVIDDPGFADYIIGDDSEHAEYQSFHECIPALSLTV